MKYRPPFALLLLAIASFAHAQEVKESSLAAYEGYSDAVYKGVDVSSTYVPTPDGEFLAVDIYTPTGGPKRDAFPVVLQYTPYQRATVNPLTGEFRDKRGDGVVKRLLAHGYIVVWADMRGTGASTGWLLDFYPPIWDDGKVLVDWIADQDWCDGNVGMSGGSYVGWSQTATAARKPEALKCLIPSVVPLEGYTGEIYPGGIYLEGFMTMWSSRMAPAQRNHLVPDAGLWPARPAYDEDGDGALHDEIPVDVNGNGTFLDDGFPPVYADGAARTEHRYYSASKEHEKNYDYHSWAQHTPHIDGASPLGYTIAELGPAAHMQPIRETKIPIYHMGGWFDAFARGSYELWCSLEKTNPSKLIMFPGYHGVTNGGYYDYLGLDRAAFQELRIREHHRFFDRYLKGIDNGVDREPRIHYFVMNGEGWRGADTWPLADAPMTDWFCAPGNDLAAATPESGHDAYTIDFTHSATFGENAGNRWVGISGRVPNGAKVRTEVDKKALVYDSPPLADAIEVTGHPIVTLYISSTADYGDVYVYLEDVAPNGEAVQITEGMLRAGYAALHDNDLIVPQEPAPFDVLPDLPWHGYRQQDYVDGILADGAVVELTFDLLPTSWVFKAGHRIRMAVAGADFPTFRLHPKLSPTNDAAAPDNIVPTISVHRGGVHASRLSLPQRAMQN